MSTRSPIYVETLEHNREWLVAQLAAVRAERDRYRAALEQLSRECHLPEFLRQIVDEALTPKAE